MRSISKEMLEELEWINKQLKIMGNGFDKRIVGKYLGRSIEFVKGALWQMEQQKQIDMSRNTLER